MTSILFLIETYLILNPSYSDAIILKTRSFYSEFFPAFLKSTLKFEHYSKKKMTLRANVFPELRTSGKRA